MYVDFKVEMVREYAYMPRKSSDNAFGMDFHAAEDKTLYVGRQELVSLGFRASISEGFGVLLKDRSGMAAKHGIHVLAGVIDSDYRGEWFVCLYNLGSKPYVVKDGDRICQGIFLPVPIIRMEEVFSLDGTERGEGGFGSTGK